MVDAAKTMVSFVREGFGGGVVGGKHKITIVGWFTGLLLFL